MKTSSLAASLAALFLSKLGFAAVNGDNTLQAPSNELRVAHPGRIWAADVEDLPDNVNKWALTNEFGTAPPYWFPFEGPAVFPSDGKHANWTEIGPESEMPSGVTPRSLATYYLGYDVNDCATFHLVAAVTPTAYTCYGVWSSFTVRSIWGQGTTSQTNFYTDAGCNDYYYTLYNWSGCRGASAISRMGSMWNIG